MRNIVFIFLIAAIFCKGQQLNGLYVGTFTSNGADGIYQCNFNSETGAISLINTFKAIDNPSFLIISPDNEKLYAVTRVPIEIEPSGGYINAYQITKNGTLQFLNKQVSHGADPCHVDISYDGKYVAVATYGGGTTSLYPINEDGSLLPAVTTIVHEGSGPDSSRQNAPHAHSIKFSPYRKQVFSADLGTDKLTIFNLRKGKLVSARQAFVSLLPGSGPRHFDFHPNDEVIYIINELSSTISVLKKNGNNWGVHQNISTVPEDFTGENYCADIHVSADGKYVYGSNRGHNSIAVFRTDPFTRELKFIATVSTHGEWPRNFTLSNDGKFLLVANQYSGNIAVFQTHPETGIPAFTGKFINLPAPVCLEFRQAN